MTRPERFTAGDIVWAAALVTDTEPTELMRTMDLLAVRDIARRARAHSDPVDAAAVVLYEVLRCRPVANASRATGWLTATTLLAAHGASVAVSTDEVVGVCAEVVAGTRTLDALTDWLRTHVRDGTVRCPSCGRVLYSRDCIGRPRAAPPISDWELLARSAYLHGVHDRRGRAPVERAASTGPAREPVLATSPSGSSLAVVAGRPVVLCPNGEALDVVEVAEIGPTDLVGAWDRLTSNGTLVGRVPGATVADDWVDAAPVRELLGAPA